MIVELIFTPIFSMISSLLGSLPTVGGTIPTTFVDTFEGIVQSVGYFLPIQALLPILTITLSLEAFNLAWRIVLRVKSFIPTMGA